MSDLISRQAAIDAVKNCYYCGEDSCGEPWIYEDHAIKAIKQLPPANCSEFPNNSDTISREAVADAINGIECTRHTTWYEFYQKVMTAVEKLPPAPTTEVATDNNVGTKVGTNLAEVGTDCISRQAAIDAIEEYADRLQMVDWKENPGVPYKAYALNWCINTIRDLPSAQPIEASCWGCNCPKMERLKGR